MKSMRYALLLLGLVGNLNFGLYAASADQVAAAGDGETMHAPFKHAAGPVMALSLEGRQAALEERIKKVSAGQSRYNTEMEDPAIADLYGSIAHLYDSTVAMQHVGFDQDNIRQLQARLQEILACLPDVSAVAAAGEDDPELSGKVNGVLGMLLEAPYEIRIDGNRGRFSTSAEAIRNFIASHQDKIADLSDMFLKKQSGVAVQNRRIAGEETHNFNRLFCYHMARVAGYDDEALIPTLLREMRECIEGSPEIVKAFNRVLVYDIRPLLLGQKFLEQKQILEGYIDSLKNLAMLTRNGDVLNGYTHYGTGDGIYTELQRVYSSLQIHVTRLRIDAIIAKLAHELGDASARRDAETRARELQAEQDAQRLASVSERDRTVARRTSLTKLADRQQGELQAILCTFQENMRPGDLAALLTGFQSKIDGILAHFDAAVATGGAAVLDTYQNARRSILAAFDEARSMLENGAKRDMADKRTQAFERFEKERAAKLAGLKTAKEPAGPASRLGDGVLRELNAQWEKSTHSGGGNAEHDWWADRAIPADAAAKEEARQRAMQENLVGIIVAKIVAKKDLKKKIVRVGQVNGLLDEPEFQKAIDNLSPEMYAEVLRQIQAAGFTADYVVDVDEGRVNISSRARFNRLKAIVGR